MQTAAEWEAQVIKDAIGFRIHRYHGNSNRDSASAATLKEAVAMARGDNPPGARILIYAITAAGRATVVPKELWDAT